jgi:hypothetical protein
MKRLLITGSRDWPDPDRVAFELGKALGELSKDMEPVIVVHGGAQGVDTLAGNLAQTYGFPVEVHKPEWRPYGIYNPQAGHQRNQRMVDRGVDLCLAFIHRGSAGATDCAERVAKRAIEDDSVHLRIFRSE